MCHQQKSSVSNFLITNIEPFHVSRVFFKAFTSIDHLSLFDERQISPFLTFWMGVSEAPLVPTVRPKLGVESLGEDSMVGVPLGE